MSSTYKDKIETDPVTDAQAMRSLVQIVLW